MTLHVFAVVQRALAATHDSASVWLLYYLHPLRDDHSILSCLQLQLMVPTDDDNMAGLVDHLLAFNAHCLGCNRSSVFTAYLHRGGVWAGVSW